MKSLIQRERRERERETDRPVVRKREENDWLKSGRIYS